MDTDDLEALIRLLYEAVAEPAGWVAFLSHFAKCAQATCTGLVVHDLERASASVDCIIGLEPSARRQYEAYFAALNPWIQNRPDLFLPGIVKPSQVAVCDADLQETEFYNDWLRPNRLFYSFGGTILKEGSLTSYLSALRPRPTGEFGDAEVELLERLMPHLQTALRLRSKIAHLEERTKAIAYSLEHIPCGVLLVTRDSRPAVLNRAAQSLLDASDGLSLENGQVRASTSNQTQRLRALVRGTASMNMKDGAGGVMSVNRASLKRPLQLLVAPVLPSLSGLTRDAATAAVFVADPEAETRVDKQVLSHLFAFTPAESRLAFVLLNGADINVAAEELGITTNTVRTHLKRMLAKTETNRQADLIRVLLNSPARFCRSSNNL